MIRHGHFSPLSHTPAPSPSLLKDHHYRPPSPCAGHAAPLWQPIRLSLGAERILQIPEGTHHPGHWPTDWQEKVQTELWSWSLETSGEENETSICNTLDECCDTVNKAKLGLDLNTCVKNILPWQELRKRDRVLSTWAQGWQLLSSPVFWSVNAGWYNYLPRK